jgi:hypothetical protein
MGQRNGGSGKQTGPTIGIPRALTFFKQAAMWTVFFERLGARVIFSRSTSKETIDSTRREFSFRELDLHFRTTGYECGACQNNCEMVCVLKENEYLDSWGNRCEQGTEFARRSFAANGCARE